MRCIGLWYGGANYAAPNGHDPRDVESFDSISHARRVFESRADHDPYRPCVEDESTEMHVYLGTEYHENGPDRVIRFGPRGGVLVERN